MFNVSCLNYLKGIEVTAFWRPGRQKANFLREQTIFAEERTLKGESSLTLFKTCPSVIDKLGGGKVDIFHKLSIA